MGDFKVLMCAGMGGLPGIKICTLKYVAKFWLELGGMPYPYGGEIGAEGVRVGCLVQQITGELVFPILVKYTNS